jgi:predicted Zn finger-like uncharacterized protein
MKFQCDRCKTRYSIGEEKIRGKVLKIRCKNCSAVITVREGQTSTGEKAEDAPASAKAGGGTKTGKAPGGTSAGKAKGGQDKAAAASADANGKKASPVLESAFNRAMERLPTPNPAKELEEDDEGTGSATKRKSAGRAAVGLDTSDASGDDDAQIEWYVSIDGEQEGPFTLPQAQKRVGKKQPAEEMYAWQEGFDDWLPVDQVAELASHLPTAKPKRGGAPPMPTDAPRAGASASKSTGAAAKVGTGAGAKKPAAEEPGLSLAALAHAEEGEDAAADDSGGMGGDYDFDIGEASRVVKLPMLVPPPRGGGADAAGAAAVRPAGLPGMGATGSQKARGTGGVAIVTGGIVADDINPSAAVLPPKKSNKHGLVFWVGGSAMVAIVGVLMVILLKTGDSSGATGEADNPSSAFVEGFYSTDNSIGYIPGMPIQPKNDPATGSPVPGKPGVRKPITPRPGIATTAEPGGRRPNVEDLSDTSAGGVSDRDAEEILDAQKRFGAGLKWCFERSLKVNPDLKGKNNRYDVQITIQANGGVSGVSVSGNDKDLKECVRQKVALWSFKPARAAFTTAFPIVFN